MLHKISVLLTEIEWRSKIGYLGMTFDGKLTLAKHLVRGNVEKRSLVK